MIRELTLASASPARLQLLQRAGFAVSVRVSGVAEDGVAASDTASLTSELARLKAEDVFAATEGDVVVLGCDSLFDVAGEPAGKPGTPDAATALWRRLSGAEGVLYTGHHLIRRAGTDVARVTRVAATRVRFAGVSDAEIAAYVATGEPLAAAGGFRIAGRGGPLIESIEGDPHNVEGLSLPLLRQLLAEVGLAWTDLWRRP